MTDRRKSDMRKDKKKRVRIIILTVIAVIVLVSAAILGMCLFIERPAVQEIAVYQSIYSEAVINVAEDGGVEIFPVSAEKPETGIIFYVGAQIKPDAYIPLLARIAEQGYACFIPDLTFNTALLEANAAEEIIKSYTYIGHWIIAGHSLGGLTASCYADDHPDTIEGLIFIAAYSNRDMKDADMPTLSIYGDTDGVLNRNLYEKRKEWNPGDFEEYIIPGANHAQFGDYGKQPRDNDAVISAEDQQARTAEIILDWLDRHIVD